MVKKNVVDLNKLCFCNWVNSFRAIVGGPLVAPLQGWHRKRYSDGERTG